MSGHSKWHNIQEKKGKTDAKRASIFTKLGRAVAVAARGGGDPTFNFQLRMAVLAAKSANMPKDRIEAAIERGVGGSGEAVEEVVYEGYGPGGVALVISGMTDNRNRTVSELKNIMSKNGGTLGASGSVMWMFEKKGIVVIEDASSIKSREEFELALIDAGADQIDWEGSALRVVCAVPQYKKVIDAIEAAGLKTENAKLGYVAKTTADVSDPAVKTQLDQLLTLLDDYDDVSEVFTNER